MKYCLALAVILLILGINGKARAQASFSQPHCGNEIFQNPITLENYKNFYPTAEKMRYLSLVADSKAAYKRAGMSAYHGPDFRWLDALSPDQLEQLASDAEDQYIRLLNK